MPQFHSNAAATAAEGLDAFTAAYIMAIYFTDTGDSEQPDSEIELSMTALNEAKRECHEFQTEGAELLATAYARGYTPAQAGHDFWLTRNGHGAGFWDRDELENDWLGDRLSDFARDRFGETWTDVGSDGMLWLI